jgi:DNA polymerase alpha subunit A
VHAGGFVIDEDGLGYADVGEEVDWGTAEDEPQAEGPGSDGKGKGKKGAAAGGKRKAAAEPVPGARVRMQKMFQSAQSKAKPRAPVDDASADALLDDILGGLGSGAQPGQRKGDHLPHAHLGWEQGYSRQLVAVLAPTAGRPPWEMAVGRLPNDAPPTHAALRTRPALLMLPSSLPFFPSQQERETKAIL